jgi:hypothetical protein
MFQGESFALRLGTLDGPRQSRREKYVRGLETKNWNTLGHGEYNGDIRQNFCGCTDLLQAWATFSEMSDSNWSARNVASVCSPTLSGFWLAWLKSRVKSLQLINTGGHTDSHDWGSAKESDNKRNTCLSGNLIGPSPFIYVLVPYL